jgi:recombination protein RecR
LLKRSPAFESLIAEFNKLPGIGRKSAERLAYHILKIPRDEADALAKAIYAVKDKIFFCSVCFNLTEVEPCLFCSSESRDRTKILVVEDAMDIASFEKSGSYNGLFHVIQGKLAPLKGMMPDQLRIPELVQRVKKESIEEVIIATNPDVEGDATALYISRQLEGIPVEITRIGLGIPIGGALEYVDSMTLQKALEGRKKI